MLNERDIKTALIDRLFEKGMLEDAVLINEMVIANWNRRADIAVANGRLYAYEIKSDLDNLDRLGGQVSAYLDRFDKVTVVTTAKFALTIAAQMPRQVEIWEASGNRESVSLRVVRRGRTKEINSRRMLCGFLLKSELLTLLRACRTSAPSDATRQLLIQLTQDVPIKNLRQYVLDCLKLRYRQTFETFVRQKGAKTRQSDLDNLSKSKLTVRRRASMANETLSATSSRPKNYRTIDLVRLARIYGAVPDSMPSAVLRRASSVR